MGQLLSLNLSVQTTTCYVCAVPFGWPGIPERMEDKKTFWCPNGHTQSFTGEALLAKVARLIAEKETQRSARVVAEQQLEEKRVQLQRLRRRIANGVCPAGCKRTFVNLASHIKTKHPGFPGPKAVK